MFPRQAPGADKPWREGIHGHGGPRGGPRYPGRQGVAVGARLWYKTGENPAPSRVAERFPGLYRLLLNKYWVDEIYNAVFVDFGKWLCRLFWTVDAEGVDGTVNGASRLTVFLSQVSALFDFRGVDGLVNAIADLIQGGSQSLKRIQTGMIQNYILAMALGVFAIVSLFYFF